ncbi:MAG: ribbon-helix-helix domain-containing protein, partial [Nocardioides sp.]
PTVRGRVTPTEYAALKTLESQTGRTQSDLVREAVHQLLVDHKLVS